MTFICEICPRKCGAARTDDNGGGFCRCGGLPAIARAAPHFGEEPCISGERGSGTIFFGGCSLGCVFCQNVQISRGPVGTPVTEEGFCEVVRRLVSQGVHNINLVTPTHFSHFLAAVFGEFDPGVPVCWNSSGYELPETLHMLEGRISVFMPDFKYAEPASARKYACAPDYPQHAKRAILEMYRQTGPYELDKDGLLKKGVLIRHLVLPGSLDNTFSVIDWVAETFPPGEVLFSLMSQYTPVVSTGFPELHRTLTEEEYNRACAYLDASGIVDGFYQDCASATEHMIPDFDGTGVLR